jgi:hypothetical protein
LPELVPGSNYRYYDFAKRIFEYFTVIAPHDDYLPNVNPDRTRDVAKDNTTAYRYYDPNMSGGRYRPLQQIESIDPQLPPNKPAAAPQHAEVVKNIDPGTGSNAPEDNVGVHGLININTANWKVLSTVPFTPDAATNAQIAKAIVLYRDGDPATNAPANGPFRSLFDLYKVSEFINLQPVPITNTTEPDDDDGDFSPFDPTIKPGDPKTDGVVNQREFERQFILINRISNLLTTRSDSFTAYVIVQGWRNANTANAELVVQRRAAMLIDRAGVTRDNREPRTMLIPVE